MTKKINPKTGKVVSITKGSEVKAKDSKSSNSSSSKVQVEATPKAKAILKSIGHKDAQNVKVVQPATQEEIQRVRAQQAAKQAQQPKQQSQQKQAAVFTAEVANNIRRGQSVDESLVKRYSQQRPKDTELEKDIKRLERREQESAQRQARVTELARKMTFGKGDYEDRSFLGKYAQTMAEGALSFPAIGSTLAAGAEKEYILLKHGMQEFKLMPGTNTVTLMPTAKGAKAGLGGEKLKAAEVAAKETTKPENLAAAGTFALLPAVAKGKGTGKGGEVKIRELRYTEGTPEGTVRTTTITESVPPEPAPVKPSKNPSRNPFKDTWNKAKETVRTTKEKVKTKQKGKGKGKDLVPEPPKQPGKPRGKGRGKGGGSKPPRDLTVRPSTAPAPKAPTPPRMPFKPPKAPKSSLPAKVPKRQPAPVKPRLPEPYRPRTPDIYRKPKPNKAPKAPKSTTPKAPPGAGGFFGGGDLDFGVNLPEGGGILGGGFGWYKKRSKGKKGYAPSVGALVLNIRGKKT